jgi:hypothetical protein
VCPARAGSRVAGARRVLCQVPGAGLATSGGASPV